MFRQRQCSVFNNRTIDPLLPAGARFEPKYNGMLEKFFFYMIELYINGEFGLICLLLYGLYNSRCKNVDYCKIFVLGIFMLN
jgi:hypothetical protein